MFKILLAVITVAVVTAGSTPSAFATKMQFSCKLIPSEQYELKKDSILFHLSRDYPRRPGPFGPYSIRITPLEEAVSPVKDSNIKLDRRVFFANKKVSYADILYISDKDSLYECGGSPP